MTTFVNSARLTRRSSSPATRGLSRLTGTLLLAIFAMVGAPLHAQWKTESYPLIVGWNAIWLSLAAQRLYRPLMGELLLDNFRLVPAAL